MRGVIVYTMIILFLVAYMVFAPPAVEGVGEAAIDVGDLDQSQVDRIESFYTALFVHIPLVIIFGMLAWGVTWYIQRQATIGRLR